MSLSGRLGAGGSKVPEPPDCKGATSMDSAGSGGEYEGARRSNQIRDAGGGVVVREGRSSVGGRGEGKGGFSWL